MDLTDNLWLVFVIAVALLVVVVAILGVRFARQTRAQLTQWAERNGWTYTHKEPNLTDRWTQAPIRGAGSASNIVRGTVPEGEVTCFRHTVTIAGSSQATNRIIGVLDVGTALPTVIAATPNVTFANPRPPEPVKLGDPQFEWPMFAADPADAATAARLFNPQVRQRLSHEASSVPRIELALEGQEIIVTKLGHLEADNLDGWVDLLRDLARKMDVRSATTQPPTSP